MSAAKSVKDPQGNKGGRTNFKLLLPAYYLVGHSIELSLKSYLAAKGSTPDKLKRKPYGHNLKALFSEARRRKLGREVILSEDQVKAIRLLNETYCSKEFEYLEYKNYRLPEYGPIYTTAKCLLDGLARYASNSPFNKKLQRTSR